MVTGSAGRLIRPEIKESKKSRYKKPLFFLHLQPILPCSIMVVREILALYVRVRILARQLLIKKGRRPPSLFNHLPFCWICRYFLFKLQPHCFCQE